MQYLMGIDVGTSGVKTALFDLDGNAVCQVTRPLTVTYQRPGWAEQSPDDWWRAICEATREIAQRTSLRPGELMGIGIDGQSWSAIPVRRDEGALCPTPIWMDTRCEDICAEYRSALGEERVFEVCGNPLMPSYTLPKVIYLKRTQPEVYARAERILQSNGYIAFKLTGEYSQDVCQGYGWQCFDMRRGRWDEGLCEAFGIDARLLPEIVPCDQVIGRVTREAAEATGLFEGIPVVAGGLDAACGTLGAGVIAPGQTQEQGGQAGGMSICLDEYRADPRLILSWHVTPGKWLLQGGTVGGGGTLNWFERELGAQERAWAREQGGNSFEQLSREAGEVPAGSEGLIFLPYMAGERSPLWNPAAKGVFYGLDYTKTRAHMARAVMEGVAYSVRHNIDVAERCGAHVGELRAMGGSANSLVWTQLKADVLGHTFVVPDSDNATTLGAAMLAGVGVGAYAGYEEAVRRTVRIRRRHEPNAELAWVYGAGYERYLALGEALKGFMK